jgi:hypothetical protein
MWTFGRFFVAEAYAIRIPDGLAQALQSFGRIAVYIPAPVTRLLTIKIIQLWEKLLELT